MKTSSWLDEPVFREAYSVDKNMPGELVKAFVDITYAAQVNRFIKGGDGNGRI